MWPVSKHVVILSWTKHHNDVTWTSWRLKSRANAKFVQAHINFCVTCLVRGIHRWPVVTGGFPSRRGQWCRGISIHDVIMERDNGKNNENILCWYWSPFSETGSLEKQSKYKLNLMQTQIVPWHWPSTSNRSQWADCVENLVWPPSQQLYYNDVIMGAMASQMASHDCLLNRPFRRRSKKTSKLRVTGLCVGNSPVTGEFPAQWPVTRKMFPFDDVIVWKLGSPHAGDLNAMSEITGAGLKYGSILGAS